MNINQICLELFGKKIAHHIQTTKLKTDGTQVVVAENLTEKLLSDLFNKKICAVHIPSYFSKSSASKATQWILKNSKTQKELIPYNRVKNNKTGMVKTGMSYRIGFPLHQAIHSKTTAKKYISEAIPNIHKVRLAFSPFLSPIDRLRLELEEYWNPGTNILHFRGKKGFVGLVRTMQANQLLEGVANTNGICHIDGDFKDKLFTANLYVNLPPRGGELKLWNIELNSKVARHPLYKLIRSHHTYLRLVQEIIHARLPKPFVIRPKTGDLIIFDASRPHAVCGFSQGFRVNIQTWLRVEKKTDILSLYS